MSFKKFHKIVSSTNQQIKLIKKPEFPTLQEGDKVYISQKLDGSNASVNNFGEVFSHNTQLDGINRTLEGFYSYATDNEIHKDIQDYIEIIFGVEASDDIQMTVYGEWLVPHRVDYTETPYSYKEWYVFAIYVDGINIEPHYLPQVLVDEFAKTYGYAQPQGIYGQFTSFDDIQATVDRNKLHEGLIVTALDKLDENGSPLMIKFVRSDFRETNRAKKLPDVEEAKVITWFHQYLTTARVVKSIDKTAELFPDVKFDKTIFKSGFDWKKIGEDVFMDILEESQDTPENYEKYKSKLMKASVNQVAKTIAAM